MKAFICVLLISMLIPSSLAEEGNKNEVMLTEDEKITEYQAMIDQNKPAFVCIVFAYVGGGTFEETNDRFELKYAEAMKKSKLAAEVAKTTGLNDKNKAKTVETGAKTPNDVGAAGETSNISKPTNDSEAKKLTGSRLLEGETKENQEAKTPKPTTQQIDDIMSSHTIRIDCYIPIAEGVKEKITFGGSCNPDTITLSYKPKTASEPRITKTKLPAKEDVMLFVTDAMAYNPKNSFNLNTNHCIFEISSGYAIRILMAIIIAALI